MAGMFLKIRSFRWPVADMSPSYEVSIQVDRGQGPWTAKAAQPWPLFFGILSVFCSGGAINMLYIYTYIYIRIYIYISYKYMTCLLYGNLCRHTNIGVDTQTQTSWNHEWLRVPGPQMSHMLNGQSLILWVKTVDQE